MSAVSIVRYLGLALLVGIAPAHAEPTRVLPVDEAGEVPEFAAWRQTLSDAVARRDLEVVVAMADPEIRLSFGDNGGRDTFRDWLNGLEGEPWSGEAYWQELEKVLALGGMWEDWNDGAQHFCAPYTFTVEVPADLDVFDAAFVVEPEAPLYSGPDTSEALVTTLDYDLLRVIEWGFDPENPDAPYWLNVRTLDGAHEGYVESTQVRSPVDYRACFTGGANGDWMMDLFVAGD